MTATNPKPAPCSPRVRSFQKPSQIPEIPTSSARRLDFVADRFAFRANDYYLGLID